MSAGRQSTDPTDLLVVDPTQPEVTKRARRHLTKWQKDTFLQYGFSKALLREVILAGWDQVDINNYNNNNNNNNNLFSFIFYMLHKIMFTLSLI